MKETRWNIELNGKIAFPCSVTVFDLIVKNPGINLEGIHNLNYRGVYSAIQILLKEEKIFIDNNQFYPNN